MEFSAQHTTDEQKIWNILTNIPDPEIPVLSILDLGIVRAVKLEGATTSNKSEQQVEIVITPTYTGCPAMDMIASIIRLSLLEKGYHKIKITSVLSPPWTTDWISEAGREKLKAYGIAPPSLQKNDEGVQCPHCQSLNTRLISAFGSTPCKALYQCNECHEPFDYFKCH